MKFYQDPVYIEMCRKAEEIQGQWIPVKGDWFVHSGKTHCLGRGLIEYDYSDQAVEPNVTEMHEDDDYNMVPGRAMEFADGYDGAKWVVLGECIWLPRLDQLLDMIMFDDRQKITVTETLWNMARWEDEYSWKPCPECYTGSFERLALGYLMESKYGKRWTGEEWVKI